MFTLYVYYRLDPRQANDAETPIRALMDSLACRCGVSAQLLKKRDDPLLWMEAYTGIVDADAFERALKNAADAFDLGQFIDGLRHIECFHAD